MISESIRHTVEAATDAVRSGGMVVVTGERDVGYRAAAVRSVDGLTATAVNELLARARGPLYVTLQEERLDELRLAVIRSTDSGPEQRAIHVPVDVRHGTTTGLSAADRAATIRALVDPESTPGDFRIPGHVTPIGCRKGGVLERAGHTEATVDLVRLAGRTPAAVVCPILGPSGDVATPDDARAFAGAHGLPLVDIAEIASYRRWIEDIIERVGETLLPLPEGRFRAIGYRDPYVHGEHMALVLGDLEGGRRIQVHVHTECLAGDALGYLGCGCRDALHASMAQVSDAGTGIILYLRTPGGDAARLRHLTEAAGDPDTGGHPPNDAVAISILRDLGVDADRAVLT